MRYDGNIYKGPKHHCKDCQKRHLACHDTCEDFINARNEWVERGRAIKDVRRKEKVIIDHEVESTIRNKKNKRR